MKSVALPVHLKRSVCVGRLAGSGLRACVCVYKRERERAEEKVLSAACADVRGERWRRERERERNGSDGAFGEGAFFGVEGRRGFFVGVRCVGRVGELMEELVGIEL